MKALRIVTAIIGSTFGNFFLAGAVIVLGNYLFEWSVDKVSVEWQTSLFFAGVYLAIGIVPAIAAPFWLGAVGRSITLTLTSLCLLTVWLFVSLLTYRLNAGYLWLVVGIPVCGLVGIIRTFQHRGVARAA